MNNIVQIGDIALVELPEVHIKKHSFYINEVNCLRYTYFTQPDGKYPASMAIQLPSGSWQLIGLASEIGEDVAKGLVESDSIDVDGGSRSLDIGFINYYRNESAPVFDTALSSLASLLKSHNLEPNYTVILKRVK